MSGYLAGYLRGRMGKRAALIDVDEERAERGNRADPEYVPIVSQADPRQLRRLAGQPDASKVQGLRQFIKDIGAGWRGLLTRSSPELPDEAAKVDFGKARYPLVNGWYVRDQPVAPSVGSPAGAGPVRLGRLDYGRGGSPVPGSIGKRGSAPASADKIQALKRQMKAGGKYTGGRRNATTPIPGNISSGAMGV